MAIAQLIRYGATTIARTTSAIDALDDANAITEEKEEQTLGLLKMAGIGPLAMLTGKWLPRMIGVQAEKAAPIRLLEVVSFGAYGLKAVSRGRLTARQIEAARRAMSRAIKRGGRIWIRIFPDKPVSQKPAEVRMGNGKGNPEFWVSEIKPGAVRPLKVFGRDLVLFRTTDGAATVLDAHCAHLGAHLGVGGRVEGNTIVCPFHAWAYDGSG